MTFVDEIVRLVRTYGVNMYSICLYEDGRFQTLQLQEANEKNNVYSVSKSITSLLLGMLVDRGEADLRCPVYDLFEEAAACGQSALWKEVRLANLLTHTTGFSVPGLDIDQENPDFFGQDYLRTALNIPLSGQPGAKMLYSDANYYLISRLIFRMTGQKLQDLARERLFRPLGVAGTAWATCPDGYAMGATGLYLSTYDMAKIGVLLLQNGVYDGQPLISSRWIRLATAAHVICNDTEAYGYGFWRERNGPRFWANGMLGQLIFVSPEKQRVLAWQSCSHSADMSRLTEALLALDASVF